MDEKNITVVAKPAQVQEEIELDLLDLLAAFLLKWKMILALLLVGAFLGYGWAHFKNVNNKMEPVEIEKAVEDARGQLSEDKAVAVEQLFFQYVSYLNLQKEIRTYYSSFAASDVTVDNTVQMRSEYYTVSDIRDLDTVFIKMAVTEADYQAMREIAPDEKAGATIYDRVIFTTAYNEKPESVRSSTNSAANNTINNTIRIPVQEGAKNAYLVNVELYGSSEEQCREMMAVIDAAFRREAEELKVLDPEIRLESLGEQFNSNVADYVQNLHKKNLDRMTVSETELNNLTTKIGKFTPEEKAYYELLLQQYEGTYSSALGKHVSGKKWTVIGAFLGLVIAFCTVFFPYLMDGKVKTAGELEQSGRVLNRVFVKGKKNLSGRWAARLIHADDTDPTMKADMVATDVGILMEKNGKNTVMLLCSQEDVDAASFAEQVKARLLAKNGELKVSVGNPLRSVDELEMVAQADMGVAFAEMKKSKRSVLREWRQICERYKLPLAGSVAVQRCW
ncbi:MAG: hypothetical protein IJH70_16020 [Oscillospiraceae bacterium]|nr:hypothetical protein [Oscillospiraceae bacterium]